MPTSSRRGCKKCSPCGLREKEGTTAPEGAGPELVGHSWWERFESSTEPCVAGLAIHVPAKPDDAPPRRHQATSSTCSSGSESGPTSDRSTASGWMRASATHSTNDASAIPTSVSGSPMTTVSATRGSAPCRLRVAPPTDRSRSPACGSSPSCRSGPSAAIRACVRAWLSRPSWMPSFRTCDHPICVEPKFTSTSRCCKSRTFCGAWHPRCTVATGSIRGHLAIRLGRSASARQAGRRRRGVGRERRSS